LSRESSRKTKSKKTGELRKRKEEKPIEGGKLYLVPAVEKRSSAKKKARSEVKGNISRKKNRDKEGFESGTYKKTEGEKSLTLNQAYEEK